MHAYMMPQEERGRNDHVARTRRTPVDPNDAELDGNLTIQEGHCRVLFAFDIGLSIDLDRCEHVVTELKQRDKVRHRRRTPKHFEFHPLPVRVTQSSAPFGIAQFTSSPSVDLVLYDFGAVLVVYEIPIHGSLQDLLGLSNELYDNESLLADSRKRVEQLMETIGSAVARPRIADAVEDYVIYDIRRIAASDGTPPLEALPIASLAQILRSERALLSEEEIHDAAQCRISFGREDLTLIDWNAAFVFDQDSENIMTVLECANVELLEMRHLDQKLDEYLGQAYQSLSGATHRKRRLVGRPADIDRVAQLQVDSAIMFEGVNNALKLVGDQYLARVYQLALQRFHLAEWDASIIRKLETLDSIYTKMSDRHATRRLEVLEWIIIVLIGFSIIMPFIPGLKY